MIKRKRTPFYQALNNLDKDLKNIIKFDIKEQSLEIFPFSTSNDETLKIFYFNDKLTFQYKSDFYYKNDSKINLSFLDNYNNKINKLRNKFKQFCYYRKLEKMREEDNIDHSFYGRLMEPRHYSLDNEEKKQFEEKVDNEILCRNISLGFYLDDNIEFQIFDEPFKNDATEDDFKSSLSCSRLCYEDTITKQIIDNDECIVKIEEIISYYEQLSEKVEKIIKEFVSYRILKSIPKRYFNL